MRAEAAFATFSDQRDAEMKISVWTLFGFSSICRLRAIQKLFPKFPNLSEVFLISFIYILSQGQGHFLLV